jgi:biopolymer transport protein ExbD/biopolymer transport protein TolR
VSTALAEINVVPLVDVMLVLLIIFMVTASAMEFGLEIEVPKVKGGTTGLEDAPVVMIDKGGTLHLKDRPVNINVLVAEIRKRYKDPKSVYVRADKSVQWDVVAKVMSILGHAKLNVNAVTQTETIGK